MTATTHAKPDESLRELSADELDQIAGATATTNGCAYSTQHPQYTLIISDITVGGVPTGGPPIGPLKHWSTRPSLLGEEHCQVCLIGAHLPKANGLAVSVPARQGSLARRKQFG
jgi:hypothetical protein